MSCPVRASALGSDTVGSSIDEPCINCTPPVVLLAELQTASWKSTIPRRRSVCGAMGVGDSGGEKALRAGQAQVKSKKDGARLNRKASQ